MKRILSRIERAVPEPGSLGEGHSAVPVIRPEQFERNDPFIQLVEERFPAGAARPAAGPHPNAGIESVTLVLEGKLRYRDQSGEGTLEAGDVQWLTAGRGVIRSESMDPAVDLRTLRLWLTLPKMDRWVCPASQLIRAAGVPFRREPGAELRLYSGGSGGLKSPTRNHVPVTLADIRLDPGASITQGLDTSENGLLYGVEGSVQIEGEILRAGELGWLNRPKGKGSSAVRLVGGERGARIVLFAGRMQHEPIVHCGPFVADSNEDIIRAYQEYRSGRMGQIQAL